MINLNEYLLSRKNKETTDLSDELGLSKDIDELEYKNGIKEVVSGTFDFIAEADAELSTAETNKVRKMFSVIPDNVKFSDALDSEDTDKLGDLAFEINDMIQQGKMRRLKTVKVWNDDISIDLYSIERSHTCYVLQLCNLSQSWFTIYFGI